MVGAAGVPAGDGQAADHGFGAARTLLEAAEQEARRILADAERQARARAQEADLLVAKARRLLVAAEERAAVVVATARARAVDGLIDLRDGELGGDLHRVIAPAGNQLGGTLPVRIDRMLASAIAHAVDEAFPVDAQR